MPWRLPRSMLRAVLSQKDLERLLPEPETCAEWSKSAKRALRRKLRVLREALPEAAAAARNRRILERLLAHPRVREARRVALFWPMLDRREIDLRPLDAQLRTQNVQVYYPFMDRVGSGGITTGFRLTADCAELRERGHRFAEPLPSQRTAERGELDLVIVPAL